MNLPEEIKRLYERNPVGCCLRIALDDGNLKDMDLKFCAWFAAKKYHGQCEDIANELLKLSPSRRREMRKNIIWRNA